MQIMLASLIDHTLLQSNATTNVVTKLCQEAIQFGFCSVCVNPHYLPLVKNLLASSAVKTCTVVGFPLGAELTKVKIYATQLALDCGADEIDMVINIAALKSGELDLVTCEIEEIFLLTKKYQAILKVIIETCLLTHHEKIIICRILKEIGVDFVKTSTGFSHKGANVDDIKLIRQVTGPSMGIKASGGISSYLQARDLINAGATRLGTSKSVQIMAEWSAKNDGDDLNT